jgi:ankyrin repeat protein
MNAASTGNITLLENLLEQGIPVDMEADDGYTAMHCAARTGQVAMIRYLLTKGCNIDAPNIKMKDRRPIHEAILSKDVAAVATLVCAGANLLLQASDDRTVFYYAASTMDLPLAQAFFQPNEELLCTHEKASLLITSSVKAGNAPLLKWLLSTFPETLPQPKHVQRALIYIAIRRRHREVAEILLAFLFPASKSNKHFVKVASCALPYAARANFVDVVKALLRCSDININHNHNFGETALHYAAEKGNEQIARILLDHKDINANIVNWSKQTPLHLAAQHGHSEIVELLLAHASVVSQLKDRNGQTPLAAAFFHCRWHTLQAIAQYQGIILNINVEATKDELPTTNADQFLAMTNDLFDRELLSKNTFKWDNIARMAVISGETVIVRFLLEKLEFDVKQGVLDRGRSMLHLATQHHRHDIFQLCLEHPKVDINKQSYVHKWQGGAIYYAIEFNNMTAFKLLLARPEIDVTHRAWGDGHYETALDLAKRLERHEMVMLLLQHCSPRTLSKTDTTTFDLEANTQLGDMADRQQQLQTSVSPSYDSRLGYSEEVSDSDDLEEEDMAC